MHCPEPALSFLCICLPSLREGRSSALLLSRLSVYYTNKKVLFIFTKKIEKIFSHIFKIIGGYSGQKKCASHFSLLTYYDTLLFIVYFFFHFSFLHLASTVSEALNELWLSHEKAYQNPKPWPAHHPQHWDRAGQPKIRKTVSSGYISEDSQQTGFSIREAITKCQITRSSKR